jgi:hypothetical protein
VRRTVVPLTCADLELNEDTHEAQKTGRAVKPTSAEFKLLRYLMTNTGAVLSKSRIRDHVWGSDLRVSTNRTIPGSDRPRARWCPHYRGPGMGQTCASMPTTPISIS